MDRELVEKTGIPFYPIFSGKLRRYFSLMNLIDPLFVLLGFFQSFFLIIKIWPHSVFSKGGFVSVPVVLAAWILRRPVILHESDSRMGIANRFCALFAKEICISFPALKERYPYAHLTGNPVRTFLLNGNRDKGYQFTKLSPRKPIVLIWGGSQGAQEINEMVFREVEDLTKLFQVIHVKGKGKGKGKEKDNYLSFDYIGKELPHIYAITDFVVGRAGANSLAELALMQKPNITIPLKKC